MVAALLVLVVWQSGTVQVDVSGAVVDRSTIWASGEIWSRKEILASTIYVLISLSVCLC